jgi:tripartite-type tricarboxylate transporter receptor subunit TctC
MRRTFLAAAAAAFVLGATGARAADAWPSRPVRIIVPFPAGGAQDMVARIVAESLSQRLKQPVLVENRPGAAGNIGAEALAKAAPDGYTFGVLSGVHTANAAFFRKLNYSLDKDFVPVRALGDSAVVIVAAKDAPFKDLPQLLAYAKANPGRVDFGSTTSLVIDLLKTMTGADITMVPYKGLGDALQDAIGGRIQLAAGPSPQLIPLVQDGKIKALALASTKRIRELPGVATVNESVPGYDAGMWYGLFAPAGTPQAVTERVRKEVGDILQQPAIVQKLSTAGIDKGFSAATPAAISERMQQETARWRGVAARTGNYAN